MTWAKKTPPKGYLCHICFQIGHYIRDCPQVSIHTDFPVHALFIIQIIPEDDSSGKFANTLYCHMHTRKPVIPLAWYNPS